MKSSKVCITTKSTLASLLFKGLATKHATVKWTIQVATCTFMLITSQVIVRKDLQPRGQFIHCNFVACDNLTAQIV